MLKDNILDYTQNVNMYFKKSILTHNKKKIKKLTKRKKVDGKYEETVKTKL